MTAAPMVGSTFFGLDISQFATRLLSIRRKISKRVLVLEFRPDSLLLAEATLTQLGVQLNHITSIPLPPEALDRGVPAEPLKMAGLIQDFCSENKIPAHRAAVVLPPELAFQRLLDLPAFLTTAGADIVHAESFQLCHIGKFRYRRTINNNSKHILIQ